MSTGRASRGRPGPGEPEVVIVPDPERLAAEAAQRIADALATAVERDGTAHWATTGGSSPAGIYRELVRPGLRDRVPWDRVHLWWGDDRFVVRADPDSNVRAADEILLAPGVGVPIPPEAVHPVPADVAIARDLGPAWAAERYADELRRSGPPVREGWPAFHVILVGIGPDGHLLSVFPDSPTWDSDALALAVAAPSHIGPHVARVSLNPRMLDSAGTLLAVAAGAAKAAIVDELLGPVRDERRLPAQRARRQDATWLLDAAAAGGRASDDRWPR
jgi:6-phosphogluconolactonase